MNRPCPTVVVGLLLWCVAGVAVAGWPKVPEPPGTRVEAVGGNMRLTGLPMRLWIFSSRLEPRRILSFYRNRWSDGFVENTFGAWQQISRMEDEYFITVQVQADAERGAFGRISIMHLDDRPVEQPGLGVPRMQGTVIINDIYSDDAGRRNRTVAMANTFSVQSNADYFRRHYLDRGWGVTMTREVEGDHMAVYRKGSDEVTVVVNEGDGGSTILLNEVRASGWFSW